MLLLISASVNFHSLKQNTFVRRYKRMYSKCDICDPRTTYLI
jgi:hypothetical protein